ncbi:MAG: sigma-70 family RNA polymerase sigma factor [Ruminococcaceae bacterium]|nr:sigma-70 family RNA polymerase sigma factor [Oscillospiraceae bacterium]
MELKDNKKLANDLWYEYEPLVRKLCIYKLKSLPDHIDDCVQDVFLDLMEALGNGKTIEYPKAWLLKVASNKIKDIYNQTKKEKENIIYTDFQKFDSINFSFDEFFTIDDEQLLALKEKVINMLNEKEQLLLHDRYTLEKPITEIAKEHNTTENNIYQRLFRLRQKTIMISLKILDEEI